MATHVVQGTDVVQGTAGDIPREKACKMLEDGAANGQPLSAKQKKLFGLICGGGEPTRAADGAVIPLSPDLTDRIGEAQLEVYLEDPGFLGRLTGD